MKRWLVVVWCGVMWLWCGWGDGSVVVLVWCLE